MTDNHLVFYVKPERVEKWRLAFQEVVEAMSKEEAFVSCYLHRDAQDKNLFTLYDRLAEPSVEASLENQMKLYRVENDAKISNLLQRPREPQVLVPLGYWVRGDA